MLREQRGRARSSRSRDDRRARPARAAGIHLHVDAVQAAPYLDVDVGALGRGHRRHLGPQVRGPEGRRRALRPARDARCSPSCTAGARSATAGPARRTWPARSGWPRRYDAGRAGASRRRGRRLAALRDRLQAACLAVDGVELTGHPTDRLPGLLSLLAAGADGAAVALALDLEGIACSTGSACATGSAEVVATC